MVLTKPSHQQAAADALLNESGSLTKKSRSKYRATSDRPAGKLSCRPGVSDPYSQGRKRPLSNVRGHNDSKIKLGAPYRRPTTTTAPTATKSSSASVFDRRNSRDRVSKREAPPTATDIALKSLLDGPSKKKSRSRSSSGQLPARKSNTHEKSKLVRPKAKVETYRHFNAPSNVLAAPPPMPSYSRGSTKSTANPVRKISRKRMSSNVSCIATGDEKSSRQSTTACSEIGSGRMRKSDKHAARESPVEAGGSALRDVRVQKTVIEATDASMKEDERESKALQQHEDFANVASSMTTLTSKAPTINPCAIKSLPEESRPARPVATNPSTELRRNETGTSHSSTAVVDTADSGQSDEPKPVIFKSSMQQNSNLIPESDIINSEEPVEIVEQPKCADWYDAEEHKMIDKEIELAAKEKAEMDALKKDNIKSRGKKTGGQISDNFVRLDMRNAAGACRGARNLKKANKQKLWRAQHRFGMSDPDAKTDGNENGTSARIKRSDRSSGGGDAKVFSSARNAGVDPLDDFIDGAFDKKKKTNISGSKNGGKPKRDESVPLCTRHQRPCKLLTVKKNNKGNKGRKFFVCSMPRGEQCDFFKWEEDTIEATQRALLQSSSSSGFIARQVAAAKTRFKELTVPELRVEAKKRGLNSSGKKDQVITRLLIWVRDEIADSVETCTPVDDKIDTVNGDSSDVDAEDSDGEQNDTSPDLAKSTPSSLVAPSSKMIDLGGSDESSAESENDLSEYEDSDGDLEISQEPIIKKKTVTSKSDSTLHGSLEQYFGYSTFRAGQEWAIRRCMEHKRTLLVAPTGQGKSLCYALPAALMEGICLVVSPLISLMQDQLRQLPPKIPAATLSGSMTTAQMALIIDDIMKGRYKVLFVSPERLASAAFRRLIRPKFNVETQQYERQFPTVSILCVDEAHCLSQWGHNFRPSYLRVRSLMPLIDPKSVLALTATAGPMVVRDICSALCIPHVDPNPNECPSPSLSLTPSDGSNGVQLLDCKRDNIDVISLVLHNHDERRYLLHKILMDKTGGSERRRNLPVEEGCLSKGSVIVYVWRQKDTEIVSEQLIGAGVRGGVVCYHGGMDSNHRSRAQSKFLRGKARICVATVAFGLGINKPDIVGVIHLCLPPSPEHYLQEIGRAGRDGRAALAIALPLADEYTSRHSLAHANRISLSQLKTVFVRFRKLVDEALDDIPPEAGVDLTSDELFVDDIHVALPTKLTVDATDCKEESIETILSILEGNEFSESTLSVEGCLPDAATVVLKRRSLDKLEQVEPIARSISKCGVRVDGQGFQSEQNGGGANSRYQGDFGGTAMDKGFYAYSFGTYKFSIVRCGRVMGPNTEPRHVYAALRRLQNKGELELILDTTDAGRAMHIRLKRDGINLFRTRSPLGCDEKSAGESSTILSTEIESLVAKLSNQQIVKEKVGVDKVESMYRVMHQVSCANDDDEVARADFSQNDTQYGDLVPTISCRLTKFQELVRCYFDKGVIESNATDPTPAIIKEFPAQNERLMACLSSDVNQVTQVLSTRQQECLPSSVRMKEHSDYRSLCLAKILHGIDAPRAPILGWYSHHLWGKYREYSFASLIQAINVTCG